MLAACLATLAIAGPSSLEQAGVRMLFLGNSHTRMHDLPEMVRRFAESDGSGRRVTVEVRLGANLEGLAKDPEVGRRLAAKPDYVILQGAATSSSHQRVHSQNGALELTRKAKSSGAKTFLFAEWPREGWDEAWYIYGVYREIADATGAELIPVCFAWRPARASEPAARLWEQDGNHSSAEGAYLAASVIHQRVFGRQSSWKPENFSAPLAARLRAAATQAVGYEKTLRRS